jgi:hypothetical protein
MRRPRLAQLRHPLEGPLVVDDPGRRDHVGRQARRIDDWMPKGDTNDITQENALGRPFIAMS